MFSTAVAGVPVQTNVSAACSDHLPLACYLPFSSPACSTARVGAIQKAMRSMTAQSKQAQQVYKRVMDRYPTNGKLFKCYGRFLEEVRNDMGGAQRAYAEAHRLGAQGNLMGMDLDMSGKPEMLQRLDMGTDAVIVIDAQGLIMASSQGVTEVTGYYRNELEGSNVSM